MKIHSELTSYDNPAFQSSSADPATSNEGANFANSVTYTWQDLCVAAEGADSGSFTKCFRKKPPSQKKQILSSVTGIAHPGELVAMMGASGAGKTTFLNVLTFRNIANLKVTGSRKVNGVELTRDMLPSIAAYVQQDDLFIGSLTVKEHLLFQARLRMPTKVSWKDRVQRVEQVLDELGLRKCENTQIGYPGRIKGISGGEMKRLSFASEVLTDPPLMFCDEPTSGLDSYMAQNVVQVLQNLAKKGKTIICTIHQPSSQVYAMFDKILLFAEGRTAFLGPAKDAVSYFGNIGYPCPQNYNPSDFFIQQLAIKPGKVDECKTRVKEICDKYESSEEQTKVAASIAKSQSESVSTSQQLKSNDAYRASWFTQLRALVWRTAHASVKDPLMLRVRVGSTLFIAILFGLIYLRQEFNQQGIQNISGSIFLFLSNTTFMNVFGVVNVFCDEVPIFLREHYNGMYRTDTYFLAKNIVEFPIYTIASLMFTTITFWMVGFSSEVDKFLIMALILILITHIGVSFGYMISCVAPNFEIASSMGPILMIPLMMFGGFFQNADSVPVYLSWLKAISWFFYGNEALAINQWDGVENIACDPGSPCIPNGAAVLETFGFKVENFQRDIWILVGLMLGFRILAFVFLLLKSMRKN